MVLRATMGKCTCTIYEQKTPACIQIVRTYAGIRDAETLSPGMLRKPGDLPYPRPRPKQFKRLATRDTLHGSRPNLRQRDPNGRIMPTPPNVSDTGVSTNRCGSRRLKKCQLYVYTPYSLYYHTSLLGRVVLYFTDKTTLGGRFGAA